MRQECVVLPTMDEIKTTRVKFSLKSYIEKKNIYIYFNLIFPIKYAIKSNYLKKMLFTFFVNVFF